MGALREFFVGALREFFVGALREFFRGPIVIYDHDDPDIRRIKPFWVPENSKPAPEQNA